MTRAAGSFTRETATGGAVRDADDDEVTAGTLGGFSRQHGLALLRFAYLISGDRHRAEDLLQDVLLAMYRRFGDDLSLADPAAYARRALVNANVSWARRAASGEIAVADFRDDSRTVAEPDPTDRDALWQALRRLPERQRTVLVMRFYLDATDQDIARTLDCRPGTVRSLASRGLEALRAHTDTLRNGAT